MGSATSQSLGLGVVMDGLTCKLEQRDEMQVSTRYSALMLPRAAENVFLNRPVTDTKHTDCIQTD